MIAKLLRFVLGLASLFLGAGLIAYEGDATIAALRTTNEGVPFASMFGLVVGSVCIAFGVDHFGWLKVPRGLAATGRMILRKLLGLFCLTLGVCLFCVNAGVTLRAWDVAEQGLSLLNMIGGVLALGLLGAGLDLLGQRRPTAAPQKLPPTRDAWDGAFQNMDSVSGKMSKER